MRVNGPGANDPVNKAKKKQGANASGADFESFLSAADETETTASASNVSATPTMGALLLLQEKQGFSGADAAAYKRGEDILDELNELRMGLLSGLISPDKLQNLAKLIQQNQSEATDPKLQEILKDIEVRALVELEKFNKTKSQQAG